MMMSNELYDILNKIQRWLPALAVFILTICTIWDLPYGEPIRDTIIAIATLLAATLEVSTAHYNKLNGGN
jgi:hypothetical protein